MKHWCCNYGPDLPSLMEVDNKRKKTTVLYIITIKSCCFSFLGLNNARIPTREPATHMSTGPTGGGGRENLLYFAVVGTTFIGAGIYVS